MIFSSFLPWGSSPLPWLYTTLLGFSSGLPFMIVVSTLGAWLKETGTSYTTIGLFIITTLPYTLKFLWTPFLSRCRIPLLWRLGHWRSWALFSQTGIMVMLILLGHTDPSTNIMLTAFMATGVCVWASTQDIALNTYRIDHMPSLNVQQSATAVSVGFRLGMLVGGAGSLYLGSFLPWKSVYSVMAALMVIGIGAVLASPKEQGLSNVPQPPGAVNTTMSWYESFQVSSQALSKRISLGQIILFLIFYKSADATLNVLNTPFLLDIGFSKLEIANIAKMCGTGAKIGGSIAAVWFMQALGLKRFAMVCMALQSFACLSNAFQAWVGYNISLCFATIMVTNAILGASATGLVTLTSSLCHEPHTASQYAFLSSLGSFIRIILSIVAGWMADTLPWTLLFIFYGVFPLLGVLLFTNHSKRRFLD